MNSIGVRKVIERADGRKFGFHVLILGPCCGYIKSNVKLDTICISVGSLPNIGTVSVSRKG